MNVKTKKRITKSLFDVGNKRVWIDSSKLKDVKEAITKKDIKKLVKNEVIIIKQKKGQSRFRIRKIRKQRTKGRRSGIGSRKGSSNARISRKLQWRIKVRNQRELLKSFRDKVLISKKTYRLLYKKVKGGFFRNKRHIEIYLSEHKLMEDGTKQNI